MTAQYVLDGVSFRYGDTIALADASLAIEQGDCIALIGPNGSGKTTLLKLLAFLDPPVSGSMSYFGDPVKPQDRPVLRRRVGLVQQNPYLLHRSVFFNVEIGLKLRGVDKALRKLRVNQILEQLRLDTLAGRRASRLSGGEAQKVAIARILVLEPEVLLFDEPFTHLDRRFATDLEDLIMDVRTHRTQTIVFSSHQDLRTHLLADRIYSLVAGRLVHSSLINLFTGKLDAQSAQFDTGNIRLSVPECEKAGTHAAVDPAHIVLSKQPLHSSMRNSFEGRVIALSDRAGDVELSVDIGEKLHVVISHQAHEEQGINIGDRLWVSFKASAVQVF